MYGYITLETNSVGQLYQVMPSKDTVAPWYFERIMPLPDQVTSGWRYDFSTGEFFPPLQPAPETDAITDAELMAIDHEYRITLLELGVF